MRLHHLPLRLATGAFILHTGLDKWQASDERAEQLRGFAAGTYPFLDRVPCPAVRQATRGRRDRARRGAAPAVVPAGLAGAALTAFSGDYRAYLKTPRMHEPGSPRPTQEGTPLAKDVWMAGIGAALVLEALTRRREGPRFRGLDSQDGPGPSCLRVRARRHPPESDDPSEVVVEHELPGCGRSRTSSISLSRL